MNHSLRLFTRSLYCVVSCLSISAFLISPASAQVNGPGPSPSNLFDTVLNLPGDEAVITDERGESIGGVLGETTQLNVNDGGEVGRFFETLSGSEVNVSGGVLGECFGTYPGSEVNISGGSVGDGFHAGSIVNISGGDFASDFGAGSDSVVNISGGTFSSGFIVFGGVVNITGATVGPVIEVWPGGEMNITGGKFGHYFSARSGSVVDISGGSVGSGFVAEPESDVELIGGEFRLNGADFSGDTITLDDDDVFSGTFADGSAFIFNNSDSLNDVTVTTVPLPIADLVPVIVNAPVVSGPSGLRAGQTLTLQAGGALGDNFAVVDATLNVEDGIIGEGGEASNSLVNISGGTVGSDFYASTGSVVNISGGDVSDGFRVLSGSEVNVSGESEMGSLTATDQGVVNINAVNVVGRIVATDAGVVNIIRGNVSGIVSARAGSEVNVSGGNVMDGIVASEDSVLNISGGDVEGIGAFDRCVVNISGGNVDRVVNISFAYVEGIEEFEGCVVNLSGGNVDRILVNHDDWVINMSGGTVSGDVRTAGSEVNISGGTWAGGFSSISGVVNISGSEFFIDGEALDTLVLGEPFTITDRDVTLSGMLADGEPFSLMISSERNEYGVRLFEDFFTQDATVTVTLVSPPAPVTLGDVNQDGVVNFADIPVFIAALISGEFNADADIDQNGVVDFDDIPAFIAILMGG